MRSAVVVGHLGLDEPRRDGVGGDAELAELDGECLGEALEPGLGCGVVGLAAVAERGGARQVDDATPARLGHVALHGARHEEGTAQVDAHHRVPVDGGHLEEQVVADDAGVVDQDGRLAQLGGDSLDRGLDRLLVGDVDADRECPTAGLLDLRHDGLAGVLIEVEYGDRETVLGEALGDPGSDTAGGTGDDGSAGPGHDEAPEQVGWAVTRRRR